MSIDGYVDVTVSFLLVNFFDIKIKVWVRKRGNLFCLIQVQNFVYIYKLRIDFMYIF